ncbi:MAG: hypothetical protein WC091_25670 [Sulfuricellaceae bacterium]
MIFRSCTFASSGWLSIILSRQSIPPGGVYRPCSQSHNVAVRAGELRF